MWGTTERSPPRTTAARLHTRLLCVIRVFQTQKVLVCYLPGVTLRSPRAKCLASVGSASHASHDMVSCFANSPFCDAVGGARREDVPSEMANHA